MNKLTDRLNGKELAEAFSDSVNNYGFDYEGFVDTFTRQHRTLQQSMVKAMLMVIERVAEPDYGRDGRNEQAHETCKQMVSGWRKEYERILIEDSNAYWTSERAKGYAYNPEVKPSNLPLI